MAATPMINSASMTRTNKVRIVGKIRGFTEAEIAGGASKSCVQITKPNGDASERVGISFGERAATCRKENYELDYCYDQNDGNEAIFLKEVKPLIAGIFDGVNATIIANGARGSGKTNLIQGADENPGLAALTVSEILSLSKEHGKSVNVSLYELYQEQVFDVLDPERRSVSVLENAQRKIQLKGLSQASLRCMSEFWKLYNSSCSSHKAAKKIPNELPRGNHRGLIIYVSSCNENSEPVIVGKMNFIDMAGYEDARKMSNDGLNIFKNVNKSLYALHNVINALNGNEIRVPYRESKLTHMLQDSLGGMNKIILVVCLNPSCCQDSIYMVSLASRSCQCKNRPTLDITKKKKTSTSAMMPFSHRKKISSSISTSVKKNSGFRTQPSLKKVNGAKSAVKGRKLFEEESMSAELAKAITSSSSCAKEEKGELVSNATEYNLKTVADFHIDGENNLKEVTPAAYDGKQWVSTEAGSKIGKENDSLIVNESLSPPLSSELQELSNSLKMLHTSSTPLSLHRPIKSTEISMTPVQIPVNDITHSVQISSDLTEPKTPEPTLRADQLADIGSTWKRFNLHSSAMKDTLVKEYLKFLNTADKEELKRLKGIGEKRATYILELRQESPEPFKNLDDVQDIGLSTKQIKNMMKDEVGELFN